MDQNKISRRLRDEYNEFAAFEKAEVPHGVSETILGQIQSAMNPSPMSVFLKMTSIHFLVGLATLALCPQFGVSFSSSVGVLHFLMRYGESVCMMGCGAFFAGTSLLVASLALRPEEVKVLRRTRVLQVTSLATLSVGALVCLGGEVVLSLGLIWILGALLGGTGFLQLGWTIRKLAVQGGL